MDRIHTPALDTATGATAEIYGQLKKAIGSVPNTFAAIGAHGPNALKAVLAAEGVLAVGSLGKKDLETIKLVVSVAAGCDYCVAAHSLLGKMAGFDQDTLRNIRNGVPTSDAKRDVLIDLVRTLTTTSGTIPSVQFEAVKDAGYTDADLVEISLTVALTAFTNVFNRINDTTIDFPAVA